MKKGIPFWMKEKLKSPYRSQTALDLRAYLAFAFGGQRRSDFFRIMNRPKRYLSRSAADMPQVDLERLQEYYRDKPYMKEILRKLQLDLARLKKMDPYAAVNYIRRGMGYDEYLRQTALEQGKRFQQLKEEADWFQRQAKEFPSREELEEHILFYERELENAAAKKRGRTARASLPCMPPRGWNTTRCISRTATRGRSPIRKA